MSITEFYRKHRESFNLTAFERLAGIKGQLLAQVSRGVQYRRLNEDQEKALKEELRPIYESLKEIFE